MKKLLLILTKKERIFFVFLVVGMFLTMIFELLGLSLVVPLAYGLTQVNIFEKKEGFCLLAYLKIHYRVFQ